jgi:hypothetical protein
MGTRLAILVIVVMATLVNANRAGAQSIESLVMPGEVVESHAEIESECSSCHVRFDRAGQTALCADCHNEVAADIEARRGYHGKADDVRDAACASCHTDHEGRDARIVVLDEQSFDHELTDFSLLGGHLEADCVDCHEPGEKHRDAPASCASCHSDDEPHDGFMEDRCVDCHTPLDWSDVGFDHETTGYSLIGGHLEAACNDCHDDQTFQVTPQTCFDCHADDDAHDGRSGNQCENCHNPVSWNDTSFDHARDTRFVLDGAHSETACNDCHSEDPFSDEMDMACVSCHLEDDEHDGHNGPECGTCHATSLWTDIIFDHDRDTEHALLGAHEPLECEACHVEPVFETPLQTGCNDCHAEDDPHEGEQGIACQDCHNETTWEEDVFFDHALTRFPLLGKHVDTECVECHETHVFRDAPELCVDCHSEDDPHEQRYTDDCASCHNPVDWLAWQFDHDRLTNFPLDGAHLDVACDDCHRQPLASMQRIGNRCGDCHRADDIHDGEFGADCGRCHSSGSFSDVEAIQ